MVRKIARRAAEWTAGELLRNVVLPWLVPIGVGVMGWLEEVSFFYLSVGVLLAGAAVTTWLVRIQEWTALNKVEHKLIFASMRIGAVVDSNAERLAAIRFGFNLHNQATFPIRFKVEEMQTSMTDQNGARSFHPTKKGYEKDEFSVSPSAVGWFEDHNIPVPEQMRGSVVALMDCKVAYGKGERLDHTLRIRKKAFLHFSESGMTGGEQWYDQ